MIYLRDDYIRLFESVTAQQPLVVSPLPSAGSIRRYYRITSEGHSLVGTFNENISENEAFFEFANGLRSIGVRVPEVYQISSDRKFYLQTDLGDTNLFQLITDDQARVSEAQLRAWLYEAVRMLALIQCRAGEQVNFERSWPNATYSTKTILDDLYYFKYYFLKMFPNFVFNEYDLDADLQRFAILLASVPSEFFMYRDFQSRNIMVYRDQLWFIDFQGARKGPLQYDIVSLLYQTKAAIPEAVRNDAIEVYIASLRQYIDPDSLSFRKFLPYFVFFRLLQVMGAYGYRGLIQKRPHFLRSIPFALRSLEDQLQHTPLKTEFPYLYGVLKRLLDIDLPNIPVSHNRGELHITLSSFSYKDGGIPIDYSGNGGGHVFDCRPLPNPGREEAFKRMTGKDIEVVAYLDSQEVVAKFFEHITQLLNLSIENYIERNFDNLMVSFGCTGGQHRSVYMAEKTFHWIHEHFPQLSITLEHHVLQKQK